MRIKLIYRFLLSLEWQKLSFLDLFCKVEVVSRRTAVTDQCPWQELQLLEEQPPQPEPPAEVLPTFPAKADI